MAQQRLNTSGWRAVVRRLRRNNRRRFNRLLARWFGTAEPRRAALAIDTRHVLVVRINKRLGNILFLTPMLRTLAARLPAATIDVLIQDPRQQPLLESLPGVGRVWIVPKRWPAVLGLARRLRRQRYDLAIDPAGDSTSNRLAMALCGARQRMGFAARDQWLRLTHAAGPTASPHQAKQSVQLLCDAVEGGCPCVFDTLAVFPGGRAQAEAARRWQRLFDTGSAHPLVVGFFVGATGGKRLDTGWWRQWYEAMCAAVPDARLVQIRAPDEPCPLLSGLPSVCIGQLDVLAAFMARLGAFAAADSGPMHLAAAAGAPVVGLFRATDPAAYAPLGRHCICLAGGQLTPNRAAGAVAQTLAARARAGPA